MSALVDAERADDARRRRHEGAAEHRRLQLVAIQCDLDGLSTAEACERTGLTPHGLRWERISVGIAKKRETRAGLLWRLEGCLRGSRYETQALAVLKELRRLLRESYEQP
jgi:hypothetical protein